MTPRPALTCDDPGDDLPTLGSCCICAGDGPANSIVMLDVRGPVLGAGWGCVVCGLPPNGAVAVVCDECVAPWRFGKTQIRFACFGFPGDNVCIPLATLTVPHGHDLSVSHE